MQKIDLQELQKTLDQLEQYKNVKIEEGHEDDKEKIYIIYVKK